MSADYYVELTIGDRFYFVHKGDAAALPAVLDGLTVGWRYPPSSPLWPTQPEPTRATFRLAAATAAELDHVDIGTPVHLLVHLGVTYPDWMEAYPGLPQPGDPMPSVRFAGRVAELNGRPQRVAGTDGWVLEVQCADYVADLAQTEVAGEIPFQGISAKGWLTQLFLLAGLPTGPAWSNGGEGAEQLTLDGGLIEAQPLSEAADRYLRTYADGGDITGSENVRSNHELWAVQGWRRGILRPLLTDEGIPNPAVPYRIDWHSQRHVSTDPTSATSYPAKLGDTGTGWGLVFTAPPPGWVDLTQTVPASHVDFRAVWRRTKNTAPTTVIVSNNTPPEYLPEWKQVTATNRSGALGETVARVTDCLSVRQAPARFVAEMYLPDNVEGSSSDYAVESFRYYASEDPAWPIVPPWFPEAGYPGHHYPVVVTGLPATQTPGPTGRGWYAGVLSSVDFTIAGGRFAFDFSLRPGAPRPAKDGGGITPDALAATPALAGLTAADLHPTHTVDDYRLVRSPAVDYPLEP